MPKRHQIDSNELLRGSEERQIGVSLPVQVSRRLDRLVDLAADGGLRAYRKDVVAALILAAEEDSSVLSDLLLRFGRARNRDAMVREEQAVPVVHIDRPKPGRRPKRG